MLANRGNELAISLARAGPRSTSGLLGVRDPTEQSVKLDLCARKAALAVAALMGEKGSNNHHGGKLGDKGCRGPIVLRTVHKTEQFRQGTDALAEQAAEPLATFERGLLKEFGGPRFCLRQRSDVEEAR